MKARVSVRPERTATAPPDAYRPGDLVRVTRGLLLDRSGVVLNRTRWDFSPGEALYYVDVGGSLGVRVLRESYLQRGS